MRAVTLADLKAIAGPGASAKLAPSLVGPINKHCPALGIDTPLRMSHFLAHICHETGHFASMAESLNYSVDGLMKTFSRARISAAQAQKLGRKPGEKSLSQDRQAAIANVVYGGAWGKKNLGNTQPSDGWDFRGSGPFQLTGRANYKRFGDAAGVDLTGNPEAARDPDTGIEVAAHYFMARMVNAADRDDIAGSTKALNGGKLGLDERRAALARAKKTFGYRAQPVASFASLSIGPDPDDDEPDEQPIEDEKTVQIVQEMLRNIGYTEVGTPNGKIGPFTRTAILAFRAESDPPLPPSDQIDNELLAALVKAPPRKLPESRTNATAAEVREKAPEAKANWLSKIWAGIGGVISAIVAFVNGVVEKLTDANEWLDPVRNFLGDIPTWAWALAGVSVAIIMYRIASRGEAAAIEAVQTGARR